MSFQLPQISFDQTQLLVGQTLDNKEFKIYLTIPLNQELQSLIKELSVKANLSKFLNDIQDLTSLIGFGLIPIGFIYQGQIPEYIRNLNILKKICDVFDVQQVLLLDQTQQLYFDLKLLKVQPAKIKQMKENKLIRLKTICNVQQVIKSNIEEMTQLLKEQFTKKSLLFNSQLSIPTKRISEYTQENCIVQFLEANTEQGSNFEDNQLQIRGQFVSMVLLPLDCTVAQAQQLLIQDLVTNVTIRLKTYFDQELNLAKLPKDYKEYLIKRSVINFQHNNACFLQYHEQPIQKDNLQKLFPNLIITEIEPLENFQEQIEQKKLQKIFEEPEIKQTPEIQDIQQEQQQQQSQEIKQENTQQQQQQNIEQSQELKKSSNQEYLMLFAVLGILIAIYIAMKL